MQLVGVIFLSAAATLAAISEDPADYNFAKPENKGKLACEICVGFWIVVLAWLEFLQICRYVNSIF